MESAISAIKAEEISYSLKRGEVFCRFAGRGVTSRFWCELLGKEVQRGHLGVVEGDLFVFQFL